MFAKTITVSVSCDPEPIVADLSEGRNRIIGFCLQHDTAARTAMACGHGVYQRLHGAQALDGQPMSRG
jgi:hypothetical protein